MNHIFNIYTKIIRELPFSITPYELFENELYLFFEALRKNEFFEEDYKFLMAGFLHIRNRNLWELAPFKKLYYHSYTKDDKVSLLSLYYHYCFGNHVISKHGGTSTVLSKLFVYDMDFQVFLSTNNRVKVDYDPTHHVLSIGVPRSVFLNPALGLNDDFDGQTWMKDVIEEVLSKFSTDLPLVSFLDDQENLALVNDIYNSEIWTSCIEKLLHPNRVQNVKQVIIEELNRRHSNNKNLFTKDEELRRDLFSDLAVSCIALSMICLYYNANVEYMLSIAKVEYEGGILKLFRNLGGLIIGYQHDRPLTKEDRVLLNMISDHVTAVVAGGYLVKNLSEEQYLSQIYDYWKELGTEHSLILQERYECERSKETWTRLEEYISSKAESLIELISLRTNAGNFTINTNPKICTYSKFLTKTNFDNSHTNEFNLEYDEDIYGRASRTFGKVATVGNFKKWLICRRIVLYLYFTSAIRQINNESVLPFSKLEVAYWVISGKRPPKTNVGSLGHFRGNLLLVTDPLEDNIILPEEKTWLRQRRISNSLFDH